MEATSVYHLALAEFVYNKGYRVCVVNPATTHAYAGSDASLKVARDWIQKNASNIQANPPIVTEGPVIVQIK